MALMYFYILRYIRRVFTFDVFYDSVLSDRKATNRVLIVIIFLRKEI